MRAADRPRARRTQLAGTRRDHRGQYYEQNPLGPPPLFLAHERESKEYVGMAALFPVELWIEGEGVPGWHRR